MYSQTLDVNFLFFDGRRVLVWVEISGVVGNNLSDSICEYPTSIEMGRSFILK